MEAQEEALAAACEESTALRAEAAATAGALAAAREQTSRLEADNAAAALINSELASRRDMLSTELAAALAAADRLRAELEDRKDTEQQIREFDAVLRRAEDMKRRYETRISRDRKSVV